MREIELRAWDKKTQKMIEHNSQELILVPCIDGYGAAKHFKKQGWGDKEISHFDWADADLISGRYILMQYTGMKDKNGKEDWVDDIVETVVGGIVWRSKIFQAESGAYCINLPAQTATGFDAIMLITVEHENIGNIYDNPELLKKGGEK